MPEASPRILSQCCHWPSLLLLPGWRWCSIGLPCRAPSTISHHILCCRCLSLECSLAKHCSKFLKLRIARNPSSTQLCWHEWRRGFQQEWVKFVFMLVVRYILCLDVSLFFFFVTVTFVASDKVRWQKYELCIGCRSNFWDRLMPLVPMCLWVYNSVLVLDFSVGITSWCSSVPVHGMPRKCSVEDGKVTVIWWFHILTLAFVFFMGWETCPWPDFARKASFTIGTHMIVSVSINKPGLHVVYLLVVLFHHSFGHQCLQTLSHLHKHNVCTWEFPAMRTSKQKCVATRGVLNGKVQHNTRQHALLFWKMNETMDQFANFTCWKMVLHCTLQPWILLDEKGNKDEMWWIAGVGYFLLVFCGLDLADLHTLLLCCASVCVLYVDAMQNSFWAKAFHAAVQQHIVSMYLDLEKEEENGEGNGHWDSTSNGSSGSYGGEEWGEKHARIVV